MAFTIVQKLDKDPKDISPDYTLDTLGEPCPYPAIVMLETMPQLQKGEILELLSDCAQSWLYTAKCRARWNKIALLNSALKNGSIRSHLFSTHKIKLIFAPNLFSDFFACNINARIPLNRIH